MHCSDEFVKKDFLYVYDYFFKGYVVNFFEWFTDCKEGILDIVIPTRFNLQSLPLELLQLDIIKKIGSSLGKLIGLDYSF